MIYDEFIKKYDCMNNKKIDELNEIKMSIVKHVINQTIETILETNVKFEGFIILGETPTYNDGEDCSHTVSYAIPYIDYDSNRDTYVYDSILDRSEFFKLLFPNESEYTDAWDYVCDIKRGKREVYSPFNNLNEREFILTIMKHLNKLLEQAFTTNYLIHVQLKQCGTEYEINIQEYTPEY